MLNAHLKRMVWFALYNIDSSTNNSVDRNEKKNIKIIVRSELILKIGIKKGTTLDLTSLGKDLQ